MGITFNCAFASSLRANPQETQQNMPDQHYVSVDPLLDLTTGEVIQGGRVLFVRLPFFHGQEQPGASYLHQVFSYFGPIAHVEQVDSKGGFVVTLAASLDTALQTANILAANFQGRANLNGDPACIQELPIHEDICGALFGQKGDNLRRIKNLSGADIEVTP